ncbi:MAG: metallophosphoesterase family protein [Dermatophilaceae bacterium]
MTVDGPDADGALPRSGTHGTRALVLADTHVPARARDLPDDVWRAVAEADLVIHAGDWVDVTLLDELEARSRAVLACWGNNDGPALRARLPEIARATVEGVRLAVVHETGGTAGREQRMRAAHPDVDLLVFGHSHIPWDTEYAGLRLLNPGSPTDRRREPSCTYLTLRLAGGWVHDVELHHLPGRLAGRRATPSS